MENNYLSLLNVRPLNCSCYNELSRFKITHDYFTVWAVFLLLRGELLYSIEKSGEHIVHAGELLICPPFYNIDKLAPSPVSVCMMTFEVKMESERIPLGNLVLPINVRIKEDLSLLTACELSDPYRKVLQMDVWYQICSLYRDPVIPIANQHNESSIHAVLNYIDKALDQKLTLDVLVGQSGYSKAAIIQKFKYHTGNTPMQYITAKRINRAKAMICDSRKTLKEVAAACGFANEFYLSSVFRRCTGMSPSEYRRRNHL